MSILLPSARLVLVVARPCPLSSWFSRVHLDLAVHVGRLRWILGLGWSHAFDHGQQILLGLRSLWGHCAGDHERRCRRGDQVVLQSTLSEPIWLQHST